MPLFKVKLRHDQIKALNRTCCPALKCCPDFIVYTQYSNLATVAVTKGQILQQGDKVGTIGTSNDPKCLEPGFPHLHWGLALDFACTDASRAARTLQPPFSFNPLGPLLDFTYFFGLSVVGPDPRCPPVDECYAPPQVLTWIKQNLKLPVRPNDCAWFIQQGSHYHGGVQCFALDFTCDGAQGKDAINAFGGCNITTTVYSVFHYCSDLWEVILKSD